MGQSFPTLKPDAQLKAALLEAAAKVSGREGAMFFDGAGHGDPALRARFEALPGEHEQTKGALGG